MDNELQNGRIKKCNVTDVISEFLIFTQFLTIYAVDIHYINNWSAYRGHSFHSFTNKYSMEFIDIRDSFILDFLV